MPELWAIARGRCHHLGAAFGQCIHIPARGLATRVAIPEFERAVEPRAPPIFREPSDAPFGSVTGARLACGEPRLATTMKIDAKPTVFATALHFGRERKLVLGSVLIGLNAPANEDALANLAIRWSHRTGATLVGLGIVDEEGIRAIEPVWPIGGSPTHDPVQYLGYDARMAQVGAAADRLLEKFAIRCEEAGVPHVEIKGVGSPVDVIDHEARACDLILLARGSSFRFIAHDDEADETLEKVSKNPIRPLVVISGECPPGPVVIASDGSIEAARALTSFAATGLGESGKIHVVSVNPSLSAATNQTERAVRFLHYHRLEAIAHPIDSTADPATVLLAEADRLKAGLFVMGAHGQPFLHQLFFGSVTRTVLDESAIPLYLSH